MTLNRVTITGADDSVNPGDLLALSQKYPFVEWGILLSKTQMGGKRFPSRRWLGELHSLFLENMMVKPSMNLSGHVCGRWVRDMLMGRMLLLQDMANYIGMFQRLQWNFHAERNEVADNMADALRLYGYEHIFQMDGVNDSLLLKMRDEGVQVFPLFDESGGAGILPEKWPDWTPDFYCGYAGGLGPDTLKDELPKIEAAARGQLHWIDMERRVRSDDDTKFDLAKVEHCLAICDEWIKGQP